MSEYKAAKQNEIKEGTPIIYHSIIGSNSITSEYFARGEPFKACCGTMVVFLKAKSGYVALEACELKEL